MNVLLLLFVGLPLISSLRLQGVAVKGKLHCGGTILRNTKVKIYDLDRNPGDADDLLDEGYTDRDGLFSLDGTTRELTDIEPVLYIYHDCDDGIRPCQKRVTIDVPTKYIHHGKATVWYDIGEIDLKNTFPNQGRSCEH
ncbi:ttr-40 [Pristionchus pacificus]|uniref:Ttr-40 n=1 Tax=Pristionchus pacificus TaxID=54126 RepID=A0A454Y342_PRIPA|nr:ttr-40 [Pristionchus pacificus]|eukprot:PDM75143.1 ttr-40 [Pristionchus pacificus]